MRMTGEQPAHSSAPGAQYLDAEYVIDEFGVQGARRLRTLSSPKVLVLGILAGAFITTGALFSALLATGTDNPGVSASSRSSFLRWLLLRRPLRCRAVHRGQCRDAGHGPAQRARHHHRSDRPVLGSR